MQVRVDGEYMHTNFGGRGLFGFGDKISLWFIIVEKFNQSESAQKKFMQVGVDVKCMHARFGGRGFFCFGDMATFQNWPNLPFGRL